VPSNEGGLSSLVELYLPISHFLASKKGSAGVCVCVFMCILVCNPVSIPEPLWDLCVYVSMCPYEHVYVSLSMCLCVPMNTFQHPMNTFEHH
jgi:hypothetical protein